MPELDARLVMGSPAGRLADGIRYLRGGSLDRARASFEAAAESRDPRIRTEALRRLADVKRRHAEWEEALRLASEAVKLAAEHGLKDDEAAALNVKGTIHLQRGELDQAIGLYRAALDHEPGPRQRGLIAQNLGTAHAQRGALEEASRWYALSSASFEVAGLRREAVIARVNEGNVHLDLEELTAAEALYRAALAELGALADPDAELQALVEMNLAEALGRRGAELDHALNLVLRSTGQFSASDNRPYLVACHRVLALISEKRGDLETAISALKRGRRLAREIGSGPELAQLDRELARLKGANDGPVAG